MATKKKIHRNDITGERGVNLIQKVVLEMGCLWYATGGVEAGIDGFIEIRDPATGEVTNSIVQVQSKATSGRFQAETEAGFDYLCDERDIDYWLNGNAPVVLVVARPDTAEAYWASVKDRFRDLDAKKSRKLHFDKQRDRFDKDAWPELVRLAISRDSGIYLAPPPKNELVHSNLLGVSRYPSRIYQARTNYRSGRELGPALRERCDRPRGEWVLTDKSIFSFHDLTEEPWCAVCERGTVESFDSDDFAFSDDKENNWIFMRLLSECLKSMLWHIHVRFDFRMRQY